jgi:hypothetical protein
VCLLRAAPGADIVLPSQADLVLILSGGASCDSGALGAGDLIEIGSPTRGMSDPSQGLLALVIGDDALFRESP